MLFTSKLLQTQETVLRCFEAQTTGVCFEPSKSKQGANNKGPEMHEDSKITNRRLIQNQKLKIVGQRGNPWSQTSIWILWVFHPKHSNKNMFLFFRLQTIIKHNKHNLPKHWEPKPLYTKGCNPSGKCAGDPKYVDHRCFVLTNERKAPGGQKEGVDSTFFIIM